MGYYGITGWSGGGRRPINYGLKAGQFRTGKYNVFENKTIINNNVYSGGYIRSCNYGYYNPNYCNNSTPSWMNWMMGIGLGTSLLGGILGMFGGGGKSEAGGVTKEETQTQDPLAGLKEAFPDGKFVKITDNLYQATIDGKTYDGTSIEDLYKNIKNGTTQKPDKSGNTDSKSNKGVSPSNDDNKQPTNLFEQLGATLMAVDEQLGSKADIAGETAYKWDQADGKNDKSKAPTEITISCNGKQYVFTRQNTTGDKITYKATSVIANGQTNSVTNNQIYELDVASGKLIQKSGTTTAADGLGSTIKWQ